MLPARSAYSRFCEGTAKSLPAARNCRQSVARSNSKIASAVLLGVSAVHCSETAYPLPRGGGLSPAGELAPTVLSWASTSESSGPWRVARTVNRNGLSRPSTEISSSCIRSGRRRPS